MKWPEFNSLPPPEKQRRIGLLFASVTALCWALLAIILKYSLSFASSGDIVWVRMIVAFTLLTGLQFFSYGYTPFKILYRPPLLLIIAGLALAFNYYGYMKGVEFTTASNTQIMIQLGPLLLAISGVVFFKEMLSHRQWLGVGVATTGFLLFYWDQIIISWTYIDQFQTGNLWIFAAALTWAVFAALQKLLSQKVSPQSINLFIFFISSIVLIPLANLDHLQKLSGFQWFILIALGFNTLIAYGCLGEALKRAPAAQVSLVITLNPLLTICLIQLLDFFNLPLITYEPLYWRGYMGALFVVTGVALTIVSSKK